MRAFHALFAAAAATALASSAFISACSSGGNGGGPGDAGTDAPTDGRIHPEGGSSGGDSGMPVGPGGTQLVKTMNLLQVDGVTSDDQVIYTDTTNSNVYAIPLKGGTPAMIAASVSANAIVTTDGAAALIWGNLNSTFTIGQLTVWTAAKGPQMLSMKAGTAAAISKDGTHIIFEDNTTATSTNVIIAGVDGSGKTTVVTNAFIGTNCSTRVGFAGNTAAASYCSAAPAADAGAETAGVLYVYSGASWTKTNVSMAMQAGGFAANQTGDHILFFDGGGLETYPVAGGSPTNIEKNPLGFIISPDGANVVYATFSPGADGGAGTVGPYKTAPVAGGNATILGNGLQGFTAISPDGKWVMGYDKAPNAMNNFTDALLASATTMGATQSLNMMVNSSPIGDSFTTDSKFAIFTDTTQQKMTNSGPVTAANLSVVAVGGSGTPIPLNSSMMSDVWQDFAGPAGKVIFNPNWTPPMNFGFGTADLMEIDTSMSAPQPKVIVSSADANFYMSADKGTIAYSYSTGVAGQPSAMSGLWAMPVP